MIVDMTLAHAVFTLKNARALDVQAWLPMYYDPPPSIDEMAARRFIEPGIKFSVLGLLDVPVAIGGFQTQLPLSWSAWLICTNNVGERTRELVRYLRGVISGLLEDGVARRVQSVVLASDPRAWRFNEACSLRYESRLPCYAGGIDYLLYSRIKE